MIQHFHFIICFIHCVCVLITFYNILFKGSPVSTYILCWGNQDHMKNMNKPETYAVSR